MTEEEDEYTVHISDVNGELVALGPESHVYVIGPISKYGKETGWNIGNFEACRSQIELITHATVSIPHDFIPEDDPYEDQMEQSFAHLRTSDAVVRLSDWADSSGATRESELALSVGVPLIEEESVC